jgi:hypothetical protein
MLAAISYVILAPHSVLQPLPRAQATKALAAEEGERAALQPWLRAVEGLLSKTKDAELGLYLRVLRNAALMAPAGEARPDVLAQRVLTPPPNPARPWIGVIVIDSNDDLPPGRWQQLASTADFAAEYHEDTNTIYLRSDIPQVPLMRGLLVVHEMRHWWQAGHPETTKDLNSRPAKEVDAYQTEFRILDALMLPRYQELLASERARIRRLFADPNQPPIQPESSNPLLEKTFGTFANPIAKQMAAAEIAVRAAFAEIDTLPAAIAVRRKIDLLRSLGYEW